MFRLHTSLETSSDELGTAPLSAPSRSFATSAPAMAPKKRPPPKLPPAPVVPPSPDAIKAKILQQQQQQQASSSSTGGGGPSSSFSDNDMDDIFGDDGGAPSRPAAPAAARPPPNKWAAATGSFDLSGKGGASSDPSSLSSSASASAPAPAADKHWACDICANINFENEIQLDAHMQSKHAGLCGNYRELRAVSEEKLRPNWGALLSASGERWRRWGEKTFHVAGQRDGGAEKIREAHAARAQLEVIVQRWNPEARVFVFGSSVVMGVWDGMSDIDYMVANVNDMERGCWPPNEKNAVRALNELLKRAGFKYSNLEPIQHARVPIIKHHAAVPLYNTIPKEAEDVVSRTVRWVFTQPLSTQDRVQFEAGLREAVGELGMAAVTGDAEAEGGAPSAAAGDAASSSTAPLPGQQQQQGSVGGGNNKASNSSSASQATYHSPITQLWWHSEHISCSATFISTTHAVKAIVHTPCVSANLVRRVGPLHDDFQPELFKIDFDLGFRPFGVRNSFLLRNYLNSHPCARPGAVVLKDWSKSSGINNSIGGYYTSYAVNIMWIYYLVQKGIIPYIDPQSIPQSLVGCTDFNPRYVPIFPPEIEGDAARREAMFLQMGELLVGFFAFYCFEFDWDRTVITLNRAGDPTLKEDLQWNDVAVVQGKKSTRYLQCIEDPYEDNLNLGRHIGDGRKWKVMQEFYRGLLSLLKDPFDASCVFAVTDNSASAAAATKKSKGVEGGDANNGAAAATEKAGDGGAEKEAPLSPPTTSDMLFLTGVAVKFVESSAQGHVSDAELRAHIAAEPTGRGALALARALAVWRWDHFIRKIGYKQLGGRVYARRVLGAKQSKGTISEEAYRTAQQQQQKGGNNSKVSTSSGDLSEQLVHRSVQQSLDRPANAPPEWVLWTPPTYALPANAAANGAVGHIPGHREPVYNVFSPFSSTQRRSYHSFSLAPAAGAALPTNSRAASSLLRRLLRK